MHQFLQQSGHQTLQTTHGSCFHSRTSVAKQRVQQCRCQALAASAAAAHADTGPTSTSSTALQVRRLHKLQDMLGDNTTGTAQPQQPFQSGPKQSSKKSKAVGFGSSSSSSSQGNQRADIKPHAPCPCKSGLQYQSCCQPFLSGHTHPRSAPELARARITAALTGDTAFLVDTTHPDSNLALGGSRGLVSRTRSQAAAFRDNKPFVLGMAHCRGDTEGTWLVLAILQARSGELAGTKAPVMFVMAKRGSRYDPAAASSHASKGSSGSATSSASSSSSGSKVSPDDWLYMGQTNKLPQHDDAEALWQLLQLHVPELLGDGASDSSSSSSSTGSSMASREVCFVWTAPSLNLPTAPEPAAYAAAAGSGGSSRGGGWYLDLLEPTVERMAVHHGGSSSGDGGGGSGPGAGATATSGQAGWGRQRAGVISMDALIEGMAARGL